MNQKNLLSAEEISAWRMIGPDVRVGVACKCGAHSSLAWPEGGEQWFEGHVLDNHVDERKKFAHLALMTEFFPPTQDSFTMLEVSGLLGDQREAIAEAILGEKLTEETLGDA